MDPRVENFFSARGSHPVNLLTASRTNWRRTLLLGPIPTDSVFTPMDLTMICNGQRPRWVVGHWAQLTHTHSAKLLLLPLSSLSNIVRSGPLPRTHESCGIILLVSEYWSLLTGDSPTGGNHHDWLGLLLGVHCQFRQITVDDSTGSKILSAWEFCRGNMLPIPTTYSLLPQFYPVLPTTLVDG